MMSNVSSPLNAKAAINMSDKTPADKKVEMPSEEGDIMKGASGGGGGSRKKMKSKDDEIALYKLRSAEALARMKQVKNMINRFEQVKLSDTQMSNSKTRCRQSSPRTSNTVQQISSANSEIQDRAQHCNSQKSVQHTNSLLAAAQAISQVENLQHANSLLMNSHNTKSESECVQYTHSLLTNTTTAGSNQQDDVVHANSLPENSQHSSFIHDDADTQDSTDTLASDEQSDFQETRSQHCTSDEDMKRTSELSNIWEKVLKPVRQRVTEIEKCLTTTTPTRSNEDIASLKNQQNLLKSSISKMTCVSTSSDDQTIVKSLKKDNEELKELLASEQKKSSSLHEQLDKATERLEKAEAQLSRLTSEFNETISDYKNVYTEEQAKATHYEDELEKAEDHMKIMEEEFIRKLKVAQNELHEEHRKNSRLLDDLRNASVSKSHVQDYDELKEKLQSYKRMVYEEQMKNTQLENELTDVKNSAEMQLMAVKDEYELKLHNADETLNAERMLNAKMADDMASAKEAVEARIVHQEQEFKQQLQSLQNTLYEEQLKSANLQEELADMIEKGDTQIQHMRAAYKQNFDNMQEAFQEENDMLSNSREELLQQVEKLTQELKPLKDQLEDEQQRSKALQEKLVEEATSNEQLQKLKHMLEKEQQKTSVLEADKENVVGEMNDLDKKYQSKLQNVRDLFAAEQKKNTMLQKEIRYVEESANTERNSMEEEYKQQINLLHEMLTTEQQANSTLKEDKDDALARMKHMEEDRNHLLTSLQEELAQEQKKNTTLLDELQTVTDAIELQVESAEVEYKQTLNHLNRKLEEEQKKAALIQQSRDQTLSHMKIKEEEFTSKLVWCQNTLEKEQQQKEKLHRELEEQQVTVKKLKTIGDGLVDKLKLCQKSLEDEQLLSSKLQQELREQRETITVMKTAGEDIKIRLMLCENSLDNELVQSNKLQTELQEQNETMTQMKTTEKDLKNKLMVCQEYLHSEQEQTEKLQYDLSEHTEIITQMKTVKIELENNLQLCQKALENERQETTRIQQELCQLKEVLSQSQSMESELKKQLPHYQQRLDDEERKSSCLQAELCEQRESISRMRGHEIELMNKLELCQKSLDYDHVQSSKHHEELSTTVTQMQNTEKELKQELAACQAALEKEHQQTIKLQEELREQKESVIQIRAKQKFFLNQLEMCQKSLQKDQQKSSQLHKELNEHRDIVTQMKATEKDLKNKLAQCQKALVDEQLQNIKLQDELGKTITDTKTKEKHLTNKLMVCAQSLDNEREETKQLQKDVSKHRDSLLQMKDIEKELRIKLAQCQKCLDNEKILTSTLQNEIYDHKETASSIQKAMDNYRSTIDDLKQTLEDDNKYKAVLQAERDDAVKRMTKMEEDLMERLDAFKEVYNEEQEEISSLKTQLLGVREEAELNTNSLRNEIATLKLDNVMMTSDKERLEWELEQLASESRYIVEGSVTSTISASTVELEPLDDKDEPETNKTNNNRNIDNQHKSNEKSRPTNGKRTIGHQHKSNEKRTNDKTTNEHRSNGDRSSNNPVEDISQSVTLLEKKLQEQEEDVSDYIRQQSQIEKYNQIYIEKLEDANALSLKEVERLNGLIAVIQGTECRQVGLNPVACTKASHGKTKAPGIDLDVIAYLRCLANVIDVVWHDDKLSLEKLRQMYACQQTDLTFAQHFQYVIEKEVYDRLHILKPMDVPATKIVEDGDWVLVEAVFKEGSEPASRTDMLHIQPQVIDPPQSIDLFLTKLLKDQQDAMVVEDTVIKAMQAQMQETATLWQHITDHLTPGELVKDCDCDLVDTQEKANCLLFGMLNQLLKMNISIGERNERLVNEIYLRMNIINSLQDKTAVNTSDSMKQHMKKEYQNKLQTGFELLAEQMKRLSADASSNKSCAAVDDKSGSKCEDLLHCEGYAEQDKNIKAKDKRNKKDTLNEEEAWNNLNSEQVNDLLKDCGDAISLKGSLQDDQRGDKDGRCSSIIGAAIATNKVHDQEHWHKMVDVLQRQVEAATFQADERTRESEKVKTAMVRLSDEIDRGRRYKQQLLCKYNSDIHERDLESQSMRTRIQQLESSVNWLRQEVQVSESKYKCDLRALKVGRKDMQENNIAEICHLRGQLKKTQLKLTDTEVSKEAELKKVLGKLSKTKWLLNTLYQEQTVSLGECKEKLHSLCKQLEIQKRFLKVADAGLMSILSDCAAEVLRMVQGTLRSMRKIHDQMVKDELLQK